MMVDKSKFNDIQFSRGGAIKSIGDSGEIEGYLITFTDAGQPDLTKQYFNNETNYYRPADQLVGMPILYHHGMDDSYGNDPIGVCTKAVFDERGLYIKATLSTDVGAWKEEQRALRKQYMDAILEMARSGELGWSSGALPQSVKVADDGWISDWFIAEGSTTWSEAMPFTNTVISAKSYELLLKGDTGHEGQSQGLKADTIPLNQLPQDMTMPPEIMAILKQILAAVTQNQQMDQNEQDSAMAAMTDVPLTEEEQKALANPEGANEQKAIDLTARLMEKAAAAVNAKRAARINVMNAAAAKATAANANQFPASRTANVGAVTPDQISAKGFIGGLDLEDMRYAHLSASDMQLGYEMAVSPLKTQGMVNIDPRSVGLSVDYLRAMVAKSIDFANNPHHAPVLSQALKSTLPRSLKANELDASNIVGQGYEWVGIQWGSTIWEAPRAPTEYDKLVARGMGTMVIPQGVQTVYIPTEGSDPIVYSSPEANSVDSVGEPEATVPITPFGTGNVALTPGELKLATSFTVVLGEDAVINVATQVNYQIKKKMDQTRDQVIFNGDTATANSTNINLIDDTPPTGIRRPYYLNSNGFRKLALVTNTAMSRDGGVFSLADFAATLALFPYAQRTMLQNLMFIMDGNAGMWALDFPQWLTPQVAGGRGFGTLENGVLTAAYGVPIITSGYIPLTGSAGKEYGLTANLGNNIKSTLIAADLSQWMVGYKRQMTIETARYPLSGTTVYVASMRMGIVSRSNTAAAVSYNLTQV